MCCLSIAITAPFGLFSISPFELTLFTAICVHEPGAAPQSINFWPGCKIRNRSSISNSLNALLHLENKT